MDQSVPVQELQLAWARLRVEADVGLRRGAWYRVTRFTPSEVFLDVQRFPVGVPRRFLEVVLGRPLRWMHALLGRYDLFWFHLPSLLLHVRPGAVRPDAVVDEEDVTPGKIFSYDMPSVTRSGVVGRPSLASQQDGAHLTQMLVEDLSAIVGAALIEPWPPTAKDSEPSPRSTGL